MSRSFDRLTTTFNPEGRIFAVENASMPAKNSPTRAAVKCKDGIIFCKGLKDMKAYVNPRLFHILDSHVAMSSSGFNMDAEVLMKTARQIAQGYRYRYDEPMPIFQLVTRVGDHKQWYTQLGGQRPMGLVDLFMGWDADREWQVYTLAPAGSFSSWNVGAVGEHSRVFKNKFGEKDPTVLTVEEALPHFFSAVLATYDNKSVQCYTIRRDENGEVQMIEMPKDILDRYLADASRRGEADE